MINPSNVYFKPLDYYKLLLRFDSKEERIFDVKPYLEDNYFSALKSKSVFKTVKLNH